MVDASECFNQVLAASVYKFRLEKQAESKYLSMQAMHETSSKSQLM